MNDKNTKRAISICEWLDATVFAVVFCVIVFSLCIKIFTVNGISMEPTYYEGDRVFTTLVFLHLETGDVIVTDDNNNLNEPLIKRVIATEFQKVDIDSETGAIYVDGSLVDWPIDTTVYNLKGDISYPFYVPEGYVFAVGDNRELSLDCRYERVGFIDRRGIVGKVLFVS